MDSYRIVAVRKNSDGDITDFKLDNAMELNYDQAVNMARSGQIQNVDVYERAGRAIIRSQRDNDPNNNLDQLPGF